MKIPARSLAAMAIALLVAACGMSENPMPSNGNGVIQGSMTGTAQNTRVGVQSMGAMTNTGTGGSFLFTGVPTGTNRLEFSGGGGNAMLAVAPTVPGEFRHLSVSLSGGMVAEENEQTETEFEGMVTAANGAVLTIAGRLVAVTDATVIRTEGAAAALADLTIGTAVEVEGTLNADGTVTATEIEIEDRNEHPADRVTFVGTLTQISGNTLMVGGMTVNVGANTLIVRGDTPLTLADLMVGDLLLVRGAAQPDKSVNATRIRVLQRGGEDEDENEEQHVTGMVAAVNPAAPSFTIGSTMIATDATTEFEGSGLTSLADLKAGDSVIAEVVKRADGSLLAKEVRRFTPPPMMAPPPMMPSPMM